MKISRTPPESVSDHSYQLMALLLLKGVNIPCTSQASTSKYSISSLISSASKTHRQREDDRDKPATCSSSRPRCLLSTDHDVYLDLELDSSVPPEMTQFDPCRFHFEQSHQCFASFCTPKVVGVEIAAQEDDDYAVVCDDRVVFSKSAKGDETPLLVRPSFSDKSKRDQVVVLRVSLHCRGCERKVRKHLSRMQGVASFSVDFAAKKVTVVGEVTPLAVLSAISKAKKNAQLWRVVTIAFLNITVNKFKLHDIYIN